MRKPKISYHELYEYCKGQYYTEGDDDEEYLWQPFELFPKEEIEGYIKNDVESMVRFLERFFEFKVVQK